MKKSDLIDIIYFLLPAIFVIIMCIVTLMIKFYLN